MRLIVAQREELFALGILDDDRGRLAVGGQGEQRMIVGVLDFQGRATPSQLARISRDLLSASVITSFCAVILFELMPPSPVTRIWPIQKYTAQQAEQGECGSAKRYLRADLSRRETRFSKSFMTEPPKNTKRPCTYAFDFITSIREVPGNVGRSPDARENGSGLRPGVNQSGPSNGQAGLFGNPARTIPPSHRGLGRLVQGLAAKSVPIIEFHAAYSFIVASVSLLHRRKQA